MLGGDTMSTALPDCIPECTTGPSTEGELSPWHRFDISNETYIRTRLITYIWRWTFLNFYLVSETLCHWLLGFRSNPFWTLHETGGIEIVLLTPHLCLNDQLRLAEGVRGGGVRWDGLDDDAIAGAEAVRLKAKHTLVHENTHREHTKTAPARRETDRQAV